MKEVESSILVLESRCEQGDDRKKALAAEVTECEAKLTRATKLITGLGGEQNRWERQGAELKSKYNTLIGDALLVSAFMVYLGPLPPTYRQNYLEKWRIMLMGQDIGFSSNFTLEEAMGDPLKIRLWNVMGLIDSHSIENAILITENKKFPLIIDPQMQAHRWIQNMEKGHKIIAIPYDDPEFLRKIRNCVEFGIPVLMEIGEKLDSGLEPLLYKQFFYLNDRKVIRIADKVVIYNDNFRMYLTTILVSPNFALELTSQVNLLDFSITSSALEDQLLSLVIKVNP